MADDEKILTAVASHSAALEAVKTQLGSLEVTNKETSQNIADLREKAVTRAETEEKHGQIVSMLTDISKNQITIREWSELKEEVKKKVDTSVLNAATASVRKETAVIRRELHGEDGRPGLFGRVASIENTHRKWKIAYSAIAAFLVASGGLILWGLDAWNKAHGR